MDKVDEDPTIGHPEFFEWLEGVADREGASSEEVLNRLVSTYWIVEELSDVLEEFEGAELSDVQGNEGEAGIDELVEVIRAESASGPAPTSTLALLQMAQSMQGDADPGSSAPDRSDLRSIRRTLEEIESSLTELDQSNDAQDQASIAEVRRRQDSLEEISSERYETLNTKLDGTFAELSESVERIRALAEANDDALEDFEDRAETLQADLEQEAQRRETDIERLEALVAEHDDLVEQLEDSVDNLSSELIKHADRVERVVSSFQTTVETIEGHLQDLYEEIGRLDQTHGDLVDVLDTRLSPLLTAAAEKRQLERVRGSARELGVKAGRCGNCGKRVDLPMLSKPQCPECNRVLSDVSMQRNWVRKKPVIEVSAPGEEIEAPSFRALTDEAREASDEPDPDAVDLGIEE